MKKWLLIAVLAAVSLIQCGCGPGVALTGEERARNWDKYLKLDAKMLVDDLDLFMLADRPSRLSRYRVP
jgi:hypothetical protein